MATFEMSPIGYVRPSSRQRGNAAMVATPANTAKVAMHRSAVPVVLAACALACLAPDARAQLLDRYFPANVPAYQDWAQAAAPQATDSIYGPLGVRVGSFQIDPSLIEGIGYDTNPVGSGNAKGSALVGSDGTIAVNSLWARNGINAAFTADRSDYLSDPRQSYTSWSATVGGLLQYADDQIQGGYSHVNAVSLPTDVGTFGATQPITDQVDDFRLSDTIGPGRVTFVPALVADIYRFSGTGNNVGANNQGLFDSDAVTTSLTAGYEFASGHNALILISNTIADYTTGEAAFRPASYDDVSVMAGLEYRQSAVLLYRVLVGYEERAPTGSGIDRGTLAAPAAEVDVIWRPTVLSTLTGKISQSLQNAPTDAAQGLTETSFQLDFQQSLKRDLMFEANAQYIRASFPASSQVQSNITASGQATWSVTRNLALSLRYEYDKGDDSTSGAQSFNRQLILLQAHFQL